MTGARVVAPQGLPGSSSYPLFSAYPLLRDVISRVPLGLWPTPIDELPRLASAIGAGRLFVKRDDVSALPYGGNKVRKLEVTLGDALSRGAQDIITFGAAGSNHALATAIYGTALGLNVTSMLTPQPNARYVRRNLLAHLGAGASVRMHSDRDAALEDAAALSQEAFERTGMPAYVIPFGGTTPVSTAGFVNAGFELAGQISAGLVPAPDVIYVPLGSMGTAAGIALGLAIGGIAPLVRAVTVVPSQIATDARYRQLLDDTVAVLRAGDAAIPPDLASAVNVEVVDGFLGDEYALFTSAGMEAVSLAAAEEGLQLEGTYTGKAMSALIADARAGDLAGKTAIFWDTYNSHDVAVLTSGVDYHDLPEAARMYFETDVQPLDAEGI
ncbi:MAG: hypothetical protein CVT66_10165 [Actinobacteria bacterium HGW-Actinobacteria-6]|jgi:1-aminocyclopropane-1-carboxylate deaminase/D-cysteine desulfhydrase-like pyridoxal-dependent ACC family enzyme|nr:MAG: hypothetical protein CVT66_10165 [Actinobacteria bacterium HGW-Actinobacteria-6]